MATITWTKGKQGDWLIRGPLGLSGTVTVSKRDGSTSTATIAKCIWQGGDVALYAVAPRGKVWDPDRFNGYGAPRGRFLRECRTGGNCSSFGSGRSCGAPDCDGY
jgi:hypothetical protein